MALQAKDFSTSKDSYSGGVTYTYIIRVTENSVNEDNNTSNVTVQAILKSSYADPFYLMTMTVTCTLNGSQIINDTQQRTCSGTGENIFCTWTGDVEHNADGSLSLSVGSQLTHTFGDTYTFMPQTPITITESSDTAMTLTHIHNYVANVVSPTCTTQGYTIYTCSGCGDSYTDSYTNALGHNYVGTVTKEPTYTSDGVMTYTCTRCEASYTEVIPKKDGGFIYIHNGSNFEAYQCYIHNGSNWELYIPYVHNGSSWDLYS